MSGKQITTAILDGVQPRFPKLIKTLNEALNNQPGTCGATLDEIGQSFEGYLGQDRQCTSDEYCWFWILSFNIQNSIVKIAFPWTQDWKKKDGLQLDRSIAVYADPQVPNIQLEQLISKLLIKLST